MLLPTEPSGYRLAQSRDMLSRAIKCAHGLRLYESCGLRAAVQTFATAARHSGFGVEGTIVALNDVLNVVLVPGFSELQRRLLGERIRQWATEDYARSIGAGLPPSSAPWAGPRCTRARSRS